jgi:hypothetical protein
LRKKKRYALLKTVPLKLLKKAEFIFQNEQGFVYRVDPKTAESLRAYALVLSGSIRKIKSFDSKSRKSQVRKQDSWDEVNRRPRLIPDYTK